MNKITPAIQSVLDKIGDGWELGMYIGWRTSPTTPTLFPCNGKGEE